MKSITDLAVKISNPQDLDKVLEEVKAPEVEKVEIFNKVGDSFQPIKHWATVRRKDNKLPLGIVSARYGVVQYRKALEELRPALGSGELSIKYAKLIDNGAKLCLIMKTSHKIDLDGGDVIDSYVALSTTQDGNGAVDPRITPIHQASGTVLTPMGAAHIKTRHSVHALRNLSRVGQMIGEVDKFFKESPLLFKRFINCPVDHEKSDVFLRTIVPGDSTRAENIREAIYKVFLVGKLSQSSNCKGTLFGLLIATQLYADLAVTVRNSKKRNPVDARFESAMCGNGAKQKALAFWTCERLVGEWGA